MSSKDDIDITSDSPQETTTRFAGDLGDTVTTSLQIKAGVPDKHGNIISKDALDGAIKEWNHKHPKKKINSFPSDDVLGYPKRTNYDEYDEWEENEK